MLFSIKHNIFKKHVIPSISRKLCRIHRTSKISYTLLYFYFHYHLQKIHFYFHVSVARIFSHSIQCFSSDCEICRQNLLSNFSYQPNKKLKRLKYPPRSHFSNTIILICIISQNAISLSTATDDRK